MADLGRAINTADLRKLRLLCIEACGTMAQAIWPSSILADMPTGKALDAVMLATQSGMKGTLNSVWAEKARLTAKAAVTEQVKRARKNLFGKFKHLSTCGDKPMGDGVRRLVNFPEEFSRSLSEADVETMQAYADSMDYSGTMDLFRKIEADKPVSALNAGQSAALRAMLGVIAERFSRPEWNGDDSTVQLHIDFRCMPGGREVQDSLLLRLTQAAHQALSIGADYSTPVLVSGLVAYGPPLKLTATVRGEVVKRLIENVPDGTDASFTSMVLEIGPSETVVKGVLSQKPKPFTLEEAECLLGNDFGYVSTSSAAVVTIDKEVDAAWAASVKGWTKAQSKTYLETHSHDGEPIDQVVFSGRKFLAGIEKHALHVDRLRSEIDLIQNRLTRLKQDANRILGVDRDARIDVDLVTGDVRLADRVKRFTKLLGVASRLKMLRRKVYRSVDGLKKSWFGFITTRLATMCVKHKAVYVREHLTILAKEKTAPDYWGRTMNRMMNNGAKGQFLRNATRKMKWWGVPEVVVPSYYTSTTDVRNSVVDKKQRKGEVFKARVDGRQMNADLHAGLTLALWLLLRPQDASLVSAQEPLAQAA